MKNINYTIGAKFSNTHDKISNEVFDCVGTSIADKSINIKEDVINQVLDRSFNSKEDIIRQILDRLKTQIYEKY